MLRFYGCHNHACSIVYNVINFRRKDLLTNREIFQLVFPYLS